MVFQYRCDTSRDLIWCHDFGPTSTLRPQNLNCAYRGFPSSLSVHSKHVGPVHAISRHIYLIHWPAVAFQYQCDTFRDLIWCVYPSFLEHLKGHIPRRIRIRRIRTDVWWDKNSSLIRTEKVRTFLVMAQIFDNFLLSRPPRDCL